MRFGVLFTSTNFNTFNKSSSEITKPESRKEIFLPRKSSYSSEEETLRDHAIDSFIPGTVEIIDDNTMESFDTNTPLPEQKPNIPKAQIQEKRNRSTNNKKQITFSITDKKNIKL